jgi:ATPase subunit of ABC transporter with duplicated ATPase domains
VWLEQWLTQRFPGILLVVSHDQVFLDTVCTDILELKSTLAGAPPFRRLRRCSFPCILLLSSDLMVSRG